MAALTTRLALADERIAAQDATSSRPWRRGSATKPGRRRPPAIHRGRPRKDTSQNVVATWWSPFVDEPTSSVTPAGPKGYIQLTDDFATSLGGAVPSNRIITCYRGQLRSPTMHHFYQRPP